MAASKSEVLRDLIFDVFNTEKGKELLGLLVDQWLLTSAYNSDEKITYMNMGKQEFVSDLVEESKLSSQDIRAKIDHFNNREVY